MELNRTYITNKGRALLAKVGAGSIMNFTKMAISSQEYPNDTVSSVFEELTTLTDIHQEVSISKVTVRNSVYVDVLAAVSNKGLKEGYKVGCLGFYATDPDEGEVLYAVAPVLQGTGDWFPSDNGLNASSLEVNLTIQVGNSANVTMEVDSRAYATVAMLNEVREMVQAIEPDLNMIRNSDFANPISQKSASKYFSATTDKAKNDMYDLWYKSENASVAKNDYLKATTISADLTINSGAELVSVSHPIKREYAEKASGQLVTISCFVKSIKNEDEERQTTWKACLYKRDLSASMGDKVFDDESKIIGQPLILQEGLNKLRIVLDDEFAGTDLAYGLGFAIFGTEPSNLNSITVKWSKMNLGEYSPWKAPNYLEERAFCQQYYYRLAGSGLFLGIGKREDKRIKLPIFIEPLAPGTYPTFDWEGLSIDAPDKPAISTVGIDMSESRDFYTLAISFPINTSEKGNVCGVMLSGYIAFDASGAYC